MAATATKLESASLTSADRVFPVLLCAARVSLSDERRTKLRELLTGFSDWAALEREAYEQGVLPLLTTHLDAIGAELVPAQVMDRLHAAHGACAVRNLTLASRLAETVSLLRENGIEAIAFKGSALAVRVYGNLSLRPAVDVDLLVKPADVPRAKQVLTESGYRPWFELNGRQEALHVRSDCEYEFTTPDGNTSVEIHWRVLTHEFAFDFPDLEAWHRVEPITLAGVPIATLGPEDRLIALCAHGARHLWRRLKWVVDIHEVVKRSRIDWPVAFERARQHHAENMVFLGLAVARDLLDTRLPPSVSLQIDARRAVRCLARQVCTRNLHDPEAERRISRHWFFLRTRERFSDKVRYVWRTAVTPQIADFDAVSNPNLRPWFYSAVRLLRLPGRLRGSQ
jgi:hypothetical protein